MYMYIYLACFFRYYYLSIDIFSFALNAPYWRSRLKNEVYMHQAGLFVVAVSLDWYDFLSFQTLDEMHFTDLIRTVNCVNDPYRSHTDLQTVMTPLIKYIQVPPMRYNFPIVYRPKNVFFMICKTVDR